MQNKEDFKKRIAKCLLDGESFEVLFEERTTFKKDPYKKIYPNGLVEGKSLGLHKVIKIEKSVFVVSNATVEELPVYFGRNPDWSFPDGDTAVWTAKYNTAKFQGYYRFIYKFE